MRTSPFEKILVLIPGLFTAELVLADSLTVDESPTNQLIHQPQDQTCHALGLEHFSGLDHQFIERKSIFC